MLVFLSQFTFQPLAQETPDPLAQPGLAVPAMCPIPCLSLLSRPTCIVIACLPVFMSCAGMDGTHGDHTARVGLAGSRSTCTRVTVAVLWGGSITAPWTPPTVPYSWNISSYHHLPSWKDTSNSQSVAVLPSRPIQIEDHAWGQEGMMRTLKVTLATIS